MHLKDFATKETLKYIDLSAIVCLCAPFSSVFSVVLKDNFFSKERNVSWGLSGILNFLR